MKNTELASELYKHYRSVYPMVNHYPGIVANFGLVQLAEIAGPDSEEAALAKEVLATFPDKVTHPKYNFPSYAICGNAKARALWDDLWTDPDPVRIYADEMMTAQRDAGGIIGAPVPKPAQRVWIDCATAVTPYLLYSGMYFKEPRYTDEAAKQTLLMFDLFRDPENGLLHQSRDFCGEGKISEDHWSRGNGWGMLPLAELCEFLPADHPERPRCEKYLKDFAKALLPYQSENGMWRQEITVVELDGLKSYEETSGTSMILYGIGIGMRLGILDKETYMPVMLAGLKGLRRISINDDYSTNNTCPGCLCPGDGTIRAYLSHKQPFRDEPHGAGPLILALAEAHRCGIVNVVE